MKKQKVVQNEGFAVMAEPFVPHGGKLFTISNVQDNKRDVVF
jgi:hypothetical protein